MPWSIFQQGGGQGAAVTWSEDLLKEIGAPLTPGNEQFVYDWEVSEGGGGEYNPLNQGPVPGQPGLTTSGSQYGGGAANFASWSAGLEGAMDYLNMTSFQAIKSDLKSNNPTAARTALIDSPWAASHYGYGSGFSNSPLPGKASALAPGGGSGNVTTDAATNPLPSWFKYVPGLSSIYNDAGSAEADLTDWAERGALMLFGGILILLGLWRLTGGYSPAGKVPGQSKPDASKSGDSTEDASESEGESMDMAEASDAAVVAA
jgi:hypothetical protein